MTTTERVLSQVERTMQAEVTESNRQHFIELNTSWMPEFEKVKPGYEAFNGMMGGGFVEVHPIRYRGMAGTGKHNFGLV